METNKLIALTRGTFSEDGYQYIIKLYENTDIKIEQYSEKSEFYLMKELNYTNINSYEEYLECLEKREINRVKSAAIFASYNFLALTCDMYNMDLLSIINNVGINLLIVLYHIKKNKKYQKLPHNKAFDDFTNITNEGQINYLEKLNDAYKDYLEKLNTFNNKGVCETSDETKIRLRKQES